MSDQHPITFSPNTVKNLVIAQSVLSGVAMVAGAASFTEVAGAKWAGLVVVVAAAVQQVISTLLARANVRQVEAATETAERAGASAARAANIARNVADELDATIHRQAPPPRR